MAMAQSAAVRRMTGEDEAMLSTKAASSFCVSRSAMKSPSACVILLRLAASVSCMPSSWIWISFSSGPSSDLTNTRRFSGWEEDGRAAGGG